MSPQITQSDEVKDKHRSIVGCLLGCAVGDALGLPYEALSRKRQQKLFGEITGHHFIFGRGMISDDTEHICMTAQVLIVSAGDPERFLRDFARRLRWWLLSLPPAIGFATLRAILKLWVGFPPDKSGVFSAGNGPAMRSAILGVCYGNDLPQLRRLVKVGTRVTHTDPKAEWAALAVAVAAHLASSGQATPDEFLRALRNALGGDLQHASDFMNLLERAAHSAARGESTESFAQSLGLDEGVSGYSFHTVPVALQTWLRQPNDFSAVLSAIRCRGDTDTVAAIVGAIIGAHVGKEGIPQQWLERMWEWPRSMAWIEELGIRLTEVCATGIPQGAAPLPVWAILPRSIGFTAIMLAHGLRRLLPPY
ncbi:MAG TPA: ADP-ribosylglycohydrolase family protein [Candidatus Angelobacter sp.]|nr:ADP-ribosylglycohydrolase family protein [Candidatus Angelobacter sp.]